MEPPVAPLLRIQNGRAYLGREELCRVTYATQEILENRERLYSIVSTYPQLSSAGNFSRGTRNYYELRDPLLVLRENKDAVSARAVLWMLERGNAILGNPPRVVRVCPDFIDDGFDFIEAGCGEPFYYEQHGPFITEPGWHKKHLFGPGAQITVCPLNRWFAFGTGLGGITFHLRSWGCANIGDLIMLKLVVYRACLSLGYRCDSSREDRAACESIAAVPDLQMTNRFVNWLTWSPFAGNGLLALRSLQL